MNLRPWPPVAGKAPDPKAIISTPLVRAQDWEQRLHAFIESRRSAPFAWGTHDCCIFAADWVLALTGKDIAADFRGKYHDEASCIALLKGMGYADAGAMMLDQLEAKWKLPVVPPTFAHRGDLIQVQQPSGPALCVVGLNGKHAHGVSGSGLVRLRTYWDATRAWRIPYLGGIHG